MAKFEKVKVCLELCNPTIGKSLHTYIHPPTRKRKYKRYLFSHGIPVPELTANSEEPGSLTVKIIREQGTAHCALAHVCSRVILEQLSTAKINRSTANKVMRYWKKSTLLGQTNYSKLLSRIRCLVLAEVEKHKVLNKPITTKMPDIIREASRLVCSPASGTDDFPH